MPTKQRPMRPGADTEVTFGQTTWWRNAGGLTILIDAMDERYRTNVVWWLDRSAPRRWRLKRYPELWWWPLGVGGAGPYPPDGVELEPHSDEWIAAKIDAEIGRNEHYAWLQNTALYKRLCEGLDPTMLPLARVVTAVPIECVHGLREPHDYDGGSYCAPEVLYCPGPV